TLGPSSITQPRSKRPPSFGTTASVPAGRLTSQTAPGVKVKAALRAPAIVYHWMPGATLIPVSTPREEGPLHPGKAQGGIIGSVTDSRDAQFYQAGEVWRKRATDIRRNLKARPLQRTILLVVDEREVGPNAAEEA